MGSGTLNVKEPARAADLGHGKQVYTQVCAACHGADGLGQRAATGAGYQFPPLWGPDSFNNGAGMGEAGVIGGSLYSPLEAISRGTEGSNPSPASGESITNLSFAASPIGDHSGFR